MLTAWLIEHVPNSPSSDWLKQMIRPIAQWWVGKRLNEINGRNCRAYVAWRIAQHRRQDPRSKKPKVLVSDQTARHELKALRNALNWYHQEHGPLPSVPVVTLPASSGQKLDYWLTRKQVADRIRVARRSYATRHLARMLLIGVYTGTRPGALLGLTWMPSTSSGYFDLEAEILHRRGTQSRRSKTKRQPPAKIPARLLVHLKRWKAADDRLGCVHVIHFRGQPVERVYTAWRVVAASAGAKRQDGPHIIRHTAATWQMQAGTDLYEAAGYLGMSPKTLWDTYGHHHPDFQSRAAANVSGRRAKQERPQETPRKPLVQGGTKRHP